MIQSQQTSQPQGVQINYLLTCLPACRPTDKLIQKIKSYIHHSSPQTFSCNFKTFCKLILNIFQCLPLWKDIQNQKIQAQLFNLLEQKKSSALQFHESQFNYLIAQLAKRSKLINRKVTQKNLSKPILLKKQQNTFFISHKFQEKVISQLIEDGAQALNNISAQYVGIINTLCCIGCKQYFYEKQEIPTSQFFSHVIGYQNSQATLQEQIKVALCSALNNGGGYIIINKNVLNYIQGINQFDKAKYDIYSLIDSCLNSLRPSENYYSFKIDKIKVVSRSQENMFALNKLNTLSNLKFVLRITLVPRVIRLFYIETKINNKLKQSFCLKINGQFMVIQSLNIYELIIQGYNAFTHKYVRKKYECIYCQSLMYNINLYLKEEEAKKPFQIQDSFIVKFKQSAILVINNKKYEEQIIKNIKKVLDSNKKAYFLVKPFQTNFHKSNRGVWFFNYDFQFQDLRRFMKIADTQTNHKLIIATRFMKIHKKSLNNFEKFAEEIKNKFKSEAISMQKQSSLQGQVNSDIYCEFSGLKQSVFAYVYLDNQGVPLQVIRYMTRNQFQLALKIFQSH